MINLNTNSELKERINKFLANMERFVEEYDPYEAADQDQDFEDNLYHIQKDILEKNGSELRNYLWKTIEETRSVDERNQAIDLLRELNRIVRSISLQFHTEMEFKVLCGAAKYLGIYQLKDTNEADKRLFLSSDDLKRRGGVVTKDNYQLVYSMPLKENMKLDEVYTLFNSHRPDDFYGHSLSISDIVLFHEEDGANTFYYVDRFGFQRVPEFVKELAVAYPDGYISIQETSEGYDYSIIKEDYSVLDGGVYDDMEEPIETILNELIFETSPNSTNMVRSIDYKGLMEKVEEREHQNLKRIKENHVPSLI